VAPVVHELDANNATLTEKQELSAGEEANRHELSGTVGSGEGSEMYELEGDKE
jgi:hypothetical protein